MQKDKTINLRLSEEELTAIDEAVIIISTNKNKKYSRSEFIRAAAITIADKVVEEE